MNGARTSASYPGMGWSFRVRAMKSCLFASLTRPTSPLARWWMGTKRTRSGAMAFTFIAWGVPPAGNALSPSLDSATTPDGSTSATMRSPGCIRAAGTLTSHEPVRLPCSTAVGTDAASAGIVSVSRSVSPWYRRTRTAGAAVLARSATTNTRRYASRFATSGTLPLRFCVAWIRYAASMRRLRPSPVGPGPGPLGPSPQAARSAARATGRDAPKRCR